ncbi:2540_t:CDS:10 [Paraglomus occultum]|uniref:2540_t:CDS:1 n=1 Tax=Paraglomus occultum TaxID=144539 RepID=A0A9N9AXY7_9GLOM|nr:2540_t:CDS:10 [Paraglomus occultum]
MLFVRLARKPQFSITPILRKTFVTDIALPNIPFFQKILCYAQAQPPTKPAIIDVNGSYTYRDIIKNVIQLRGLLLSKGGVSDSKEMRVAYLYPNGYDYVIAQCAVWAAGGIAVPLCITHPPTELEYAIKDSQSSLVLVHPQLEHLTSSISGQFDKIVYAGPQEQYREFEVPKLYPMATSRRALIIYTSGTTEAQAQSLISAWKWSDKDKILHVLPLHHLHGILNALICALYAGATVEMLPKFDAMYVWRRWTSPARDLTLFMAVPTIYSKLIQFYKTSLPPDAQLIATESCSQFRVMISGSASLPVPLRNEWKQISGGQVLLERYGMSEIGMALSNGYEAEKRVEGTVGLPLPGVEVRLIADNGTDVTEEVDTPGEVQVKGPNVFKEYWNRPEATAKEFTEDGWFKTGDIAVREPSTKMFRILGRNSVDIIKSGGYKISALEIERELLAHPDIADVAVVGVEDAEWGQRVGAVVVPMHKNTAITLNVLREFAKDRLASYKLPTLLKLYDDALPRNAMGKVNKKELLKTAFPSQKNN